MPDCATCKESRKVIPAIVHDADMERQQQDKKRLWIVIIILIAALILSNGAWVYYNSQFETVTTETTEQYEANAEDDGVAVITREGVVNIGDGEVYTDYFDKNEDAQDGR